MQSVQVDLEILYVQKLYFFMFLLTLTLWASVFTFWKFGLQVGLLALASGLIISYIAMTKKKTFAPPEKKITARRMAHTISQGISPLSLSRFASQLYYYFHEPSQAISLLEKFLPCHDPLLCITLCDILLKEGNTKRALYTIRENPHSLINPLMLATQGIVLQKIGQIPEAIKMLERSLNSAKQNKFPDNGENWLTRKLLIWGYTASIHHALADCYMIMKKPTEAKRHYWAGNLLLFDVSLWRYSQSKVIHSAENYNNSL
ncbi:tetratricopeptide repeat protein [Desulfosporosinus sp. PR]|uniref:tetratricopeptide repeat protein n=1 Tax=Candidatus Desulfosporosinus nitrosoreducens TaxID=3401928 RepID=UPI0027FF7A30|nr:tetratricopeptide repeat protein [Desulfosporosinus sp. PR]MDQ7096062.1 tetratricopeptide repeat protein [Desulfosporosinus sp. PR]